MHGTWTHRSCPKGGSPRINKKSICCNTCGNYISEGTKFNSRKEDAAGENYFGEQILRFYFKCTKCSVELVMKTDLQNSDYVVEAGARRNFEP
ncbi:PREDICTED: coiled-coil [Prunus dulcis]|uniref:PREDICTED: coiled-coil n=1 Tax=Prunus dulcis TaxID=3755 RepID=A0A5E4FC17_PRUDU|nr:PREDICTED: coiled-coil [Prunus dulcis]